MKKSKPSALDEAVEEILSEFAQGGPMFGGAAGGGSGKLSYTQTAGAKTWSPGSPPYRRQTGGASDYNVKDIADDDRDFFKTGKTRKPFPLETIDDHLVNSYIMMCNAEIQINNCIKYNAVLASNKEKKALLSHLLKKVKGIKEMIKSVVEDLDRITLS